jgi:hypothetical protein
VLLVSSDTYMCGYAMGVRLHAADLYGSTECEIIGTVKVVAG